MNVQLVRIVGSTFEGSRVAIRLVIIQIADFFLSTGELRRTYSLYPHS